MSPSALKLISSHDYAWLDVRSSNRGTTDDRKFHELSLTNASQVPVGQYKLSLSFLRFIFRQDSRKVELKSLIWQ